MNNGVESCSLDCMLAVFSDALLYVLTCSIWFFFFKQKTAYELRISDWSSDVCSSDLLETIVHSLERGELRLDESLRLFERGVALARQCRKIGRASCRARVCQ